MIENVHNDDLLIRYLDGQLPAGEKEELEARLVSDEALRQRLTSLRVAIQAVEQFGTMQTVQAVHTEMMKELKAPQKTTVVSFGKTLRYTVAIAASLVILFMGVRFYQAAQLSPDKIYNESFVDFNVSSARGNESGLSETEKQYLQKQYEAVTAGIRSLNLNAKDSLLIGLSYLQMGRIAQAIGFFQPLAFTANDYQQDAEFYLALSYLKNRSYNKALPLMEKIKNDPAHLYHNQLSIDAVNKTKKLAAN